MAFWRGTPAINFDHMFSLDCKPANRQPFVTRCSGLAVTRKPVSIGQGQGPASIFARPARVRLCPNLAPIIDLTVRPSRASLCVGLFSVWGKKGPEETHEYSTFRPDCRPSGHE